MTRVTRSRQAASSVSENNVKNTVKSTAIGAITKKSIGKTRSNVKKVTNQDENAVPTIQINKKANAKDSKAKGSMMNSKLLSNKNDHPISKAAVLTLKSPVLRDRTNTTNELIKIDTISKIPEGVQTLGNKRSAPKRTTRNTKKQSASKVKNVLKTSIKKYTVKISKLEIDHNKNKLNQNEGLSHNNKVTNVISEKIDANKNVDNSSEPLVSDKSKSKITTVPNQGLKRKNISMEDVEKLLNEDSDEDIGDHEISDNENTESVQLENVKTNDHKTKKFFKYKDIKEEIKPALINPNQNKKRRAAKKRRNDDSTFSPKMEEQRQSTKPENKKLRTRIAKNYCEMSRLSKDEAKKDGDNSIDHKGVPIYKTIKMSQEEKCKEPDEIYEFDSSQDSGQNGKKRKKPLKRPTVKRAKKATNLLFGIAPRAKKKPTNAIRKNVELKVENLNRINMNAVPNDKTEHKVINTKKNTIMNEMEKNGVIPNDFPEVGERTFEEAPTLRIISEKKLEGSDKIHLTTTPSASKTTASGLKVFGPKHAITSEPIQQYKKMENHSLIRQSMSPITKVSDEFDSGSPWRAPVDTFTRVRRLVQSTPQIKKLSVQYEKKSLEHVAELNKKSIGSEETIHLSSATNKSPNKERSLGEMSTIKQDEPRKFGTVISNLSPSKSTSTSGSSINLTTQKSPPQATSLQPTSVSNNQQSPAKAISPPSAAPNLPVNYEKLFIDDPTISFDNKENISPKTSPKKKIVAPSPFRFEKIRTSKRLAAMTSNSKSPEKTSLIKGQGLEPEAGPSWLDKPKSTVMKQTNLNSFLNIDDMPESANISTPHGIFDDICSTPVSGRKPQKFVEEANIENAFGFDDLDSSDVSPVVESAPTVKIATEADVKKSVKGKLFPKARVKSSVPSRISENTVKKTLLKDVLNKKTVNKIQEIPQEQEDSSDSGKDYEENNDQVVPRKESEQDRKKVILDAISFSDTFDVLSENGEDLEAKVPEEIPLFVDLQPAHFTQPPRKSYNKRKRNVCFDVDRYESSDDEEKHKKKAKKKHREPQLKKEEKKRMEEWVKNVNKTFDEIEHFDLVVE